MNNISVTEYNASPGLGINFKAKCYIIEDNENVHVISPNRFNQEQSEILQNTNKSINIISPNGFHNLHLAFCKETYPNANFYGPKRSEKQSGVKLVSSKEFPKDSKLKAIPLKGFNETLYYHEDHKALFITDILFNIHDDFNLITKMYLTAQGAYKKLSMPLLLKLTIKDKKSYFESIKAAFAYPFEKVHLNHGHNISREEFIDFINKISN